MNKRAQTGIITLLFFDIAFIILYPLVLADLVNIAISQAVASGNFVGAELFFITTMHLWIWLGVGAANLAGFAFSGGSNP